jgi:hypothetical protein
VQAGFHFQPNAALDARDAQFEKDAGGREFERIAFLGIAVGLAADREQRAHVGAVTDTSEEFFL